MEEPKKRLRGKQAAPQDAPVVDTLAASKPMPKKRLRGKQGVDAPASPKMAKAKARPTKGGPRAQQFTEKMQAHFKQNAGAINLAERVRKRQGKMPAAPQEPIDARDVFSKMPEGVRKALKTSRKFREEILQVPMTGVTARENYAKLIAERENLLTNARKENVQNEWNRLATEAGGGANMDQERVRYLMERYHNFDPQSIEQTEIPKPPDMVNAEAERMGRMIAAAMCAKGKGKGKGAPRG